jgi:hypothetical protein
MVEDRGPRVKIRNPRTERYPKSEVRKKEQARTDFSTEFRNGLICENKCTVPPFTCFGLRISFGISDFAFGFQTGLTTAADVMLAVGKERERQRKNKAGYTANSMMVEVTTPPTIGVAILFMMSAPEP